MKLIGDSMQKKDNKGYDLKINVLSADYDDFPENKGYSNVWFNLYGIEEANKELVAYMAQICQDNKEAKKLLINANEKIREQLKVFAEVHEARFIE
jgi:hypothetical protein